MIDKIKQIIQKYHKNAVIELPPNVEFGHISTNLPFLIKDININEIIDNLLENDIPITRHEIKKGFLNLFIDYNVLESIKVLYTTNSKTSINVEFLSPNPTGSLHLGHFRNTCIGNSISEVLKITGHKVIKEMIINDEGRQCENFISAIKRYKNNNTQEDFEYKNQYTEKIAKEITHTSKEDIVTYIVDKICDALKDMNIKFDVITLESNMIQKVPAIIQQMEKLDLIYWGTLPNQKSNDEKLLLLKKEKINDKEDRVLQNAKRYTYFMNDIAYFCDKSTRADKLLCVLGEDHIGHIKKLKEVLRYLIPNTEIIIQKYATTTANGQKMSKRTGNIIPFTQLTTNIRNEIICQIMKQNFDKTIDLNLQSNQYNIMYTIEYVYHTIGQKLENIIEENVKYNITTLLEQDIFRMILHYSHMMELCTIDFNTHNLFNFSLQIITKAHEYLKTNHNLNMLLLMKVYQITEITINVFNLHIGTVEDDEEIQEIIKLFNRKQTQEKEWKEDKNSNTQ